MEKNQTGQVSDMHECPTYVDPAFPVSMHTITKHDMFPRGRGFHDIHWHDEIQFTYVSRGSLVMRVEGKDYELEEGDAIFVNTGLIHVTTDMSDDGEYIGFMYPEKLLGFFPGSRMEQNYVLPYLQKNQLSVHLIKQDSQENRAVLEELKRLREVFDHCQQVEAFEYEVAVRLTSIWLKLIRQVHGKASKLSACYVQRQARMKVMMQYIIDHYGEPITLNEIAESASVSVEECRRCFRTIIRETPVHYLVAYRVMKGMELLRTTDLDVTEIAFRVGFNDSSYFIQAFKKKVGMTPKQYRNKIF